MEKPKRHNFNKRKYKKHLKVILQFNIKEYQSDALREKRFYWYVINLGKNPNKRYESIVLEESEHMEDIKN